MRETSLEQRVFVCLAPTLGNYRRYRVHAKILTLMWVRPASCRAGILRLRLIPFVVTPTLRTPFIELSARTMSGRSFRTSGCRTEKYEADKNIQGYDVMEQDSISPHPFSNKCAGRCRNTPQIIQSASPKEKMQLHRDIKPQEGRRIASLGTSRYASTGWTYLAPRKSDLVNACVDEHARQPQNLLLIDHL